MLDHNETSFSLESILIRSYIFIINQYYVCKCNQWGRILPFRLDWASSASCHYWLICKGHTLFIQWIGPSLGRVRSVIAVHSFLAPTPCTQARARLPHLHSFVFRLSHEQSHQARFIMNPHAFSGRNLTDYDEKPSFDQSLERWMFWNVQMQKLALSKDGLTLQHHFKVQIKLNAWPWLLICRE